jgi:hypothetical protein
MSFKACVQCQAKVPPADGHDFCFTCLGTVHDMDGCEECACFTDRVFRGRALRQQLWQSHASVAPPKPNKTLGWYKAKFAKLGLELPASVANVSLTSALEVEAHVLGPVAQDMSGVEDPRRRPETRMSRGLLVDHRPSKAGG